MPPASSGSKSSSNGVWAKQLPLNADVAVHSKEQPATDLRILGNGIATVLMVLLIGIATVSIVELTTRIGAKAFLASKIAEINGRIANAALQGNSVTLIQSGTPSSSRNFDSELSRDRLTLSEYKRLRDKIRFLEFAGTKNIASTAHAIQKQLQETESTRLRSVEAEDLAIRKSQIQGSISLIDNETEELSRFLSDSVDILRDLDLEISRITEGIIESSNLVELINNARNRIIGQPYSSDATQQIRSQLLTDLSLLTVNAETNDIVRIYERIDSWIQDKISKNIAEVTGYSAELQNIDERINELTNRPTSLSSDRSDFNAENFYWLFGFFPLDRMVFLPSDVLAAIAVIACGGIGATVAGLRRPNRRPLGGPKSAGGSFSAVRDLFLGLSAGFITFLVIKGGKFIFIIQGPEVSIPMNPYGSAFAGILAGLFTERAYQLLSSLVQQAAERVEGTAKTEPVSVRRPTRRKGVKSKKNDQATSNDGTPDTASSGPRVVEDKPAAE